MHFKSAGRWSGAANLIDFAGLCRAAAAGGGVDAQRHAPSVLVRRQEADDEERARAELKRQEELVLRAAAGRVRDPPRLAGPVLEQAPRRRRCGGWRRRSAPLLLRVVECQETPRADLDLGGRMDGRYFWTVTGERSVRERATANELTLASFSAGSSVAPRPASRASVAAVAAASPAHGSATSHQNQTMWAMSWCAAKVTSSLWSDEIRVRHTLS